MFKPPRNVKRELKVRFTFHASDGLVPYSEVAYMEATSLFAMIYDLSHTIVSGMPHFPGDPEPLVEERHGEPPWRVSALHLGSHTGTHIDAPRHYLLDGRGVGAYPLDRFIRPGVVVDAQGYDDDQPIGAGVLRGVPTEPGACVVLRTGWERYWGDARYFRHPYLGDDLAAALVERGASLLAIDALNVDSTRDGGASAHARLLGADVLIVENLRGLDALLDRRGYIFAFVPLAEGHGVGRRPLVRRSRE